MMYAEEKGLMSVPWLGGGGVNVLSPLNHAEEVQFLQKSAPSVIGKGRMTGDVLAYSFQVCK